jgi:uncharacterized SAM-binding protein YcdF (DUF218 family)
LGGGLAMSSLRRALFLTVGVTVSLLALGFFLFASIVTRLPADNNPHADGIVVLTGEGRRIIEGARLLDEGRAQRMLISGVNSRTGKKALVDLSGLAADKFDCCVDIGYAALDTVGNASETRAWAQSRGYTSLIVVTASYHMPRSLAELSLAMPGTDLIPHPILPNNFVPTHWWLSPTVTRTLVSEYFKFLPTVAHLTLSRIIHPREQSSIAEAPERPEGKSPMPKIF